MQLASKTEAVQLKLTRYLLSNQTFHFYFDSVHRKM